MTTGEKIKKLRTEKMMTQSQLVGDQITRNMLSKIESDEANPSICTLMYLAERLNVPAGYLIADEKEDAVYGKSFVIENVRYAYSSKNYRICRQLCQESEIEDDEMILLAAESSFYVGAEEFNKGRLRSSIVYFDEAISYCDKTMYYTDHIKASACAYIRYMRRFSPNLSSNVVDENEVEFFCSMSDPFCRYVYALEGVESSHMRFAEKYVKDGDRDDPTVLHLGAKIDIAHGNFRLAHIKLDQVLTNNYEVSRPVLYTVLCDLEECCKATNDFRAAYEYSTTRIDLLQRMMADD